MKNKPTKDNQLLIGLTLGFLAGSTSYFLFHSKQGKELRTKLKEKWSEAQDDLPQIKELTIGDLSLSEIVGIVLGTNKEEKKPKLKIKSSSRSSSRSKTKKPKKFKGV